MKDGVSVIVPDLSFSLDAGERLAIVGESGCGKTMTAMAILSLLPSNCTREGQIIFDGRELRPRDERRMRALRGRDIVFVPQSGGEFLNPALTVGTQLAESLRRAGVKGRAALRSATVQKLREAGLDDAEDAVRKYPFQLSGGQAQKVVLASALCSKPRLVIADEPTKGIDEEGAMRFMDSLDRLFPDAAVIVITHNVHIANRCRRVLVMYRGEMMEYGSCATVLGLPSHPYTASLTAALPDGGLCPRPVLREEGHGCAFYSRCPSAGERCGLEKPEAVMADGVLTRCFYAGGN